MIEAITIMLFSCSNRLTRPFNPSRSMAQFPNSPRNFSGVKTCGNWVSTAVPAERFYRVD